MKSYQPLVLADTANLARPDWLALRRKGLGGSDAAAVLGDLTLSDGPGPVLR